MKTLRNRDRRRPVQFNWGRHWKKKVVPHLNNPVVEFALELGMKIYDPAWEIGDPPHLIGGCAGNRIVKGGLSWYRPVGRCHHIAFFSMAVGAAIHPDLAWRFVSGDRHTVPVGYDEDGNPKVVMDILLFDQMSADESIAFTESQGQRKGHDWDYAFRWFEEYAVAAVRVSVQEGIRHEGRSREAARAHAMRMLKAAIGRMGENGTHE